MAFVVSPYNNFIEDVIRGNINLATHTFKAALVYGYTFDATHSDFSAITGKLSTGNGYTAPGKNLANITVSFTSGKTKWDADDIIWTASGGTIGPATGVVIYSDTSTVPAADRLCFYGDFGAEVSALDGKDLFIALGTLGLVSIYKP